MKRVSMNLVKSMKVKAVWILALFFVFSACTDQEMIVSGEDSAGVTRSSVALADGITELPGYSLQELLEYFASLATDGVEALSPILELIDLPGDLASLGIRTFKVSTETPHPDGSGNLITVSGVLLVPANYDGDSIRFVISPVPTYTENDAAPSIIFSGVRDVPLFYDNFLNYLFFSALNTYQGCAMFMPDYPGFGDSYGQCFHPYAIKEALIRSTLDLAKVAKNSLPALGYTPKKEVIVTGYSQGGLTATAVGRELDLYGEDHDMPINLLLAGGVPANLVNLIDVARLSPALPLSFVFPYAVLGYKENIAPDLVVSDLLRSPYDQKGYEIFDGQHSVVDALAAFPVSNVGLFPWRVILNDTSNYSVARLRQLLTDNSIDPWKNTARVIFIHGYWDEAVYYSNVLEYIAAMEAVGGTPELHTNPLTEHVLTLVDYFIQLAIYIGEYK